jgi:hypothetical protein
LAPTTKYLRRTTRAAAGRGLGTSIKYFVNQNAGAGNNSTTQKLGKNPDESLVV